MVTGVGVVAREVSVCKSNRNNPKLVCNAGGVASSMWRYHEPKCQDFGADLMHPAALIIYHVKCRTYLQPHRFASFPSVDAQEIVRRLSIIQRLYG